MQNGGKINDQRYYQSADKRVRIVMSGKQSQANQAYYLKVRTLTRRRFFQKEFLDNSGKTQACMGLI